MSLFAPLGTSKQAKHLRSQEPAFIEDFNVQLTSKVQIALNTMFSPLGGVTS